MSETHWVETLKPGDEVLVCARWGVERMACVDRVTPRQVIVGPLRFWRQSGLVVGGGHVSLKEVPR